MQKLVKIFLPKYFHYLRNQIPLEDCRAQGYDNGSNMCGKHERLSCIDERSVIIQAKGISREVEVNLINNLQQEIQKLGFSWADILQESRLVTQEMELPPFFFFPFKKRNRLHSIATPDASEQLTAEDKFKTCVVYKLFRPVLKYSSLSEKELKVKAEDLVRQLKSDLPVNLCDEIVHLKHISSVVFESKIEVDPLKLLNSIHEKNLEPVIMNVCIALRLFCTLPFTVASAERAFSKLGNVLSTWQRPSMSQQRLNSLSLLAIEHSLASTLDFTES
ncbi:hypothetical protein PR048_008514 [Dryococelus australis]|uniref:HAT C-terminal dimerisation domain-containing protein n=1 Tax=Dryococelus australis TaxID=614101 RepID=A0ABQ9HXB2_9NEOP|nr:hypothetical protein PR048_008514 [Dryococelus australis]